MQTLKTPFLFVLSLFVAFPFPLLAQRDRRLERILREEGIRSYKVPIHEQSREWLIKEFGPGDPYPINLTLATKNIVWQARQQIRTGQVKPVQGIIRTFWYTHIKPVFARTESLVSKKEQSDVLHRVLVELVRDHDIMRYKDMGFLNHNAGTLRIGRNWHVMIIGEKHGKFARLEQIAAELNATIFTLGGQPSLLSMEYLVDDYKARNIDIRKSMYLIFFVDYDPAGWIIRKSVIRNLKHYGMKNLKAIDIVVPSILTKKELALAKFPLPPNQANLEDWMELTGGIDNQPYGFESDSVPFERLRQKVIEAATPLVGNPENIRRANTVKEMSNSLTRLIQIQLGLITQ